MLFFLPGCDWFLPREYVPIPALIGSLPREYAPVPALIGAGLFERAGLEQHRSHGRHTSS
eukprot:1024116-Pyramimonas_sp.AAC.3